MNLRELFNQRHKFAVPAHPADPTSLMAREAFLKSDSEVRDLEL